MFNKLFARPYLNQSVIDDIISHLDEFTDCVWIKNNEGYYLDMNSATCSLLECDKETLLKYKCNINFDKKSFNIITENDLFVMNNIRKSVINEYLYIYGKEVIVHTNKIPIINADGTCSSFLAIGSIINNNNKGSNFISDINENLKYNLIIENQKKKEGLLYSELSEYMKDMYSQPDIKGISLWLYCNSQKNLRKKMSFGIAKYIFDDITIPIDNATKSMLIKNGTTPMKPVYLEDISKLYTDTKYYKQYSSILNDKVSTRIPVVYKSNLIGILNLYYDKESSFPDKNMTSKIIYERIILSLKNIYLSKELTSQLNKKVKVENELRRFLNMAVDISLVVNTKGYIQKMSSNIPLMLGWSVKELKSVRITNFIDPTSGSVSFQEVVDSYDQKCDGGICKVFCKNGPYRLIDWYYYHEKQTDEIFIIGKDITDFSNLKNKVDELENKCEQEIFKTEFLSNISHEFKTPLNVILSSVKLELNNHDRNNCPNDKLYTHLNMIKQNSYRLLRLINNLMDLTQLETNSISIHRENTNFSSFIENIICSLSSYIKDLDRTLIFEGKNENIYLACDKEKIEKVLLNLISNSIKYTDKKGKIRIKLYTDKNRSKAYISVKDNGCGIPPECYSTIFERFKQVDNIFVRRAEGSGIGLALSKAFLELHHGDLYLNKNVKKGTEFIFYLPITTTEEKSNPSYLSKVISSEIEKFDIEFSDIYSDIS